MMGETGAEVPGALLFAFMLFSGAAGLFAFGVIVYFLVTMHRIANSLESAVNLLAEARRQAESLPALSGSGTPSVPATPCPPPPPDQTEREQTGETNIV